MPDALPRGVARLSPPTPHRPSARSVAVRTRGRGREACPGPPSTGAHPSGTWSIGGGRSPVTFHTSSGLVRRAARHAMRHVERSNVARLDKGNDEGCKVGDIHEQDGRVRRAREAQYRLAHDAGEPRVEARVGITRATGVDRSWQAHAARKRGLCLALAVGLPSAVPRFPRPTERERLIDREPIESGVRSGAREQQVAVDGGRESASAVATHSGRVPERSTTLSQARPSSADRSPPRSPRSCSNSGKASGSVCPRLDGSPNSARHAALEPLRAVGRDLLEQRVQLDEYVPPRPPDRIRNAIDHALLEIRLARALPELVGQRHE